MRRAFTRAPQQRPLSIFLFFLCVFSGCTYALAVHSHHESTALSQFTVWCPGFAALCTCLLLRIPLGTLGWGWPAPRFLRLAYFLPLIYAAPVYLLTWLVIRGAFSLNSFEAAMADTYELGRWPALGTFGVALPLLLTITVIGQTVWGLGEELGWRGFLFPRLQQRFGFHSACLISGSIWAVWHYPEILWTDFNAGTNAVFALGCFTVMVVALAHIMGYLRVRSGSIWPCVLLHATNNTIVQLIFDPLTAPVGLAKYITTEFGAGLAVATVVASVYLVARSSPEEAKENWNAMLADPAVQEAIKSEQADKTGGKDRPKVHAVDGFFAAEVASQPAEKNEEIPRSAINLNWHHGASRVGH